MTGIYGFQLKFAITLVGLMMRYELSKEGRAEQSHGVVIELILIVLFKFLLYLLTESKS